MKIQKCAPSQAVPRSASTQSASRRSFMVLVPKIPLAPVVVTCHVHSKTPMTRMLVSRRSKDIKVSVCRSYNYGTGLELIGGAWTWGESLSLDDRFLIQESLFGTQIGGMEREMQMPSSLNCPLVGGWLVFIEAMFSFKRDWRLGKYPDLHGEQWNAFSFQS